MPARRRALVIDPGTSALKLPIGQILGSGQRPKIAPERILTRAATATRAETPPSAAA